MKKILAVAMSIMLGASLAACGGSSAPATTAAPAATTAAPAETKAAEETKAEETKAEETKAEETKAAESGSYETASGWPKKKNITLIVPAGAGGTMDLVARLVVAELEKEQRSWSKMFPAAACGSVSSRQSTLIRTAILS